MSTYFAEKVEKRRRKWKGKEEERKKWGGKECRILNKSLWEAIKREKEIEKEREQEERGMEKKGKN